MKRLLVILMLASSPALAQNPTQSPASLPITGALKVELIPFGKLIDTFNDPSTLDTTGNWSAPTTSGTGAATYSQGQEVLSSGTTAGSFALLTSQSTFQITSPAFLLWRGAINSQTEVAGTCKEMGFFIAAGSPTCAAPVTDGVLFEVTTAGKLQAVTYASGARTLIADLSIPVAGITYAPIFAQDGSGNLVCPGRNTPQAFTDTCPHILDIWFNGNSAEFDVDFKPVAFMLAGSLGPNNNLLRWSALAINSSSTTATTIKINQAVVGDEARNSLRLCDPTYPTRCTTVSSGGALSTVATAPVGITPTDRTITSASGSSQQLAAANASRHSLTIENTGNANCGVNPTGGTAAIGGATGNNPGTAGNDTSLGTLCVGKGGSPGTGAAANSGGNGGAGGVAGTGDLTVVGSAGGGGFSASITTADGPSGFGAPGPWGGMASGVNAAASAVNGSAGAGCGAGGSGGESEGSASTAAGGAGFQGCVLITEFNSK